MLRLNLGAGDDRRDGFTSVDLRPEVADVVCDVRKLEHWADESVEEILAEDCLEHFPETETADLLAEWHRVLVPGGLLTVKVPNLYQLSRAIMAYSDLGKDDAVACLIRNVYGGHRWGPEGAWDTHHTGWTPTLLHAALAAAGFEVLSDDGGLNNRVLARKAP